DPCHDVFGVIVGIHPNQPLLFRVTVDALRYDVGPILAGKALFGMDRRRGSVWHPEHALLSSELSVLFFARAYKSIILDDMLVDADFRQNISAVIKSEIRRHGNATRP